MRQHRRLPPCPRNETQREREQGLILQARDAGLIRDLAKWYKNTRFGRREGKQVLLMEAEYGVWQASWDHNEDRGEWLWWAEKIARRYLKSLDQQLRDDKTPKGWVVLTDGDLPEDNANIFKGVVAEKNPITQLIERLDMDEMIGRLEGPERLVAELRRAGYKRQEIADELKCCPRAVNVYTRQLKKSLAVLRPDGLRDPETIACPA